MLLLETRTTVHLYSSSLLPSKKWQLFHILELHNCQMIAIETINILEIM
jgi:hypothetical protein